MTAQIGDTYSYKGGDYTIVATSEPLRFEPRKYGFKPTAATTACWNGYWCKYKISEEGIFLDKLFINCKDDEYLELNGKSFDVNEQGEPIEYMGHRVYSNLELRMEYSGKILVGDEFIDDYYVHMGYQRAHGYKVLKEFVFQDGNLIDVIDQSEMAEKLREIEKRMKLNENETSGNPYGRKKDIMSFVRNSFSLDYKDKCWWMR